MEFVSYNLDGEQQFWDELDDIVRRPCKTAHTIDRHLQTFLEFVSVFQDEYLVSAADWTRCGYLFLESQMFLEHSEYIRRQLIKNFKAEGLSNAQVYLTSTILLYDGRERQATFEEMQEFDLFPTLLELVGGRPGDEGKPCRNRLLELLYEMSRVQRLRWEDLSAIDDKFILYLFELVEEQADIDDPYHYVVIKVLLVLNEQYMVSAHAPPAGGDGLPSRSEVLTNKVIKFLCFKGDDFKTFGENIILLLNRETETSLQLLILKLLYLLCTTPATYEYFYRNDLYVLVDVVIRNLLDLPDDAESLRHTYLRVLYPLLAHTQLRYAPFYKIDELRMLFHTLSSIRSNHFQPVDDTTVRLVRRCGDVQWLIGKEDKREKTEPDKPREEEGDEKNLHEGRGSSVELAIVAEKPGVIAPSR
ncbi:hypothetical protein DFH27DRAFT_504077, partial [Peziza echinospora]